MPAPRDAMAGGGQAATRSGSFRRVAALVVKETRQIVRDPSSIAIGVVMPLMLIILFGFALSLDVRNAPLALVMEDSSAPARELAAGFTLSPYFSVTTTPSMREAEALMLDHRVDGIVRIPADFSRKVAQRNGEVQIVLHGTDANTARIIEAYAGGAVAQWAVRQAAAGAVMAGGGPVGVDARMWFNEADDSHYFLVPGLIVLIITLIGAFLTALVVAREWERGTFEALLVTPVRSREILLGKLIPYFTLGMVGFVLCILAAEFLFHVPLRGSLIVLTAVSMLYLLVALGIGLVASSLTRSQFIASQISLLATFLPAMMLSGFLFDLRSMPFAVQAVTYVLPARYFVALLQTIFLAGNVWPVILPNAAVLAVMAAALMLLARLATQKRLAG
jgi:ABC-2 type transport system permease protein